MRGKLVGEPADLAATHRIGLAGQRERPHAGTADASGQQMAIDDGVDLVDAARRLVDALRIQRDDTLGAGEPVEEQTDSPLGQAAGRSRLRHGLTGHLFEGVDDAGRTIADKTAIDRIASGKEREQPVEQHAVAAGAQRQMQIGALAGRGAARIDHHDLARRVLLLRRQHALMQDRMAPGGIGADQHQQVRLFEILVAARHGVAAERALVPSHAGGHA